MVRRIRIHERLRSEVLNPKPNKEKHMKTEQTNESISDTFHALHNSMRPAPNKAQHSPEYYKNRNQADDLRLCAEIYGRQSPEFEAMLERQREKPIDYKAHADKLAEQLKQCLHTLPLHSKNPVIRQIITESWQTISANEAAQ